ASEIAAAKTQIAAAADDLVAVRVGIFGRACDAGETSGIGLVARVALLLSLPGLGLGHNLGVRWGNGSGEQTNCQSRENQPYCQFPHITHRIRTPEDTLAGHKARVYPLEHLRPLEHPGHLRQRLGSV